MDKRKNNSRNKTGKIIRGSGGMCQTKIKNQYCNKCKSEEDLEVHHETYPEDSFNIREAIESGKIHYLCKECHRKVHGARLKIRRKVVCVFGKFDGSKDFILKPVCEDGCDCDICKEGFWIERWVS